MRACSKTWKVNQSMRSINGTDFRDKIMEFDDHERIQFKPISKGIRSNSCAVFTEMLN
ncbi:hypothetical protein [Ammoniphilus oxalaticus]|uniref:hypothetical protein n=1 Tax=Ammoniphilus oxalaticus TaxID=66863 RepID=UPI001473E5AF|nr:hypothetical protein [Ammoniphilus oxalaticus]